MMHNEFDLAINGGSVVLPSGAIQAHLGITDGRIASISSMPLTGRETLDATGKIVVPGGIDPHVHFRMYQKSVVTSDDYATGSRSAACGGVTTYIDFAVQPSGGSALAAVQERLAEAQRDSTIDYAFHAALTTATDATLAEIEPIVALGVRSFKFFLTYRAFGFYTDLGFLLEAMHEIGRLDGTALVHAENDEVLEHLKQRQLAGGNTGMRSLALQRPDYAEEIAVASTATLARETGCRTAVVHLSSARGLNAAVRARADGAPYFVETCPQYLLLSQTLLDRADGGLYTFTPTMKAPADGEALWAGIANGDVTYAGSDHSPFDRTVKLGAATFDEVYPGIPGTETLLPLLFAEGVNGGRMTLERFASLTSGNAASVFQLRNKGSIQPGYDADLVVIDPAREVRLSSAILHSRCDYTPYEGRTLRGYPVATVSRGEVVMRNGEFTGRAGRGQLVARGPERVEVDEAAVALA
jgi:dihydropyrimidinase